ncbi:hypothetical protein P5673_016871 [Acropora cervicornis]|uniref:Uncharacterized protein n=1 Tax=Acropora cervicornis TaxID=6130 RepID=A0AAD9QGH0_ACRCE|nr:hypothetical protein P5673_016871 [Acropora cervicornis]
MHNDKNFSKENLLRNHSTNGSFLGFLSVNLEQSWKPHDKD